MLVPKVLQKTTDLLAKSLFCFKKGPTLRLLVSSNNSTMNRCKPLSRIITPFKRSLYVLKVVAGNCTQTTFDVPKLHIRLFWWLVALLQAFMIPYGHLSYLLFKRGIFCAWRAWLDTATTVVVIKMDPQPLERRPEILGRCVSETRLRTFFMGHSHAELQKASFTIVGGREDPLILITPEMKVTERCDEHL